MPMVEFAGPTRQDPDNKPANTSRLINMYREPVGGRTTHVLKSVPGMVEFATFADPFFRAMGTVDGVLYAVAGGKLYSVSSAGAKTYIGDVTDDENTTISGNNGDVTVVAGGTYYLWDGSTLTEPTTGAISGDVGSVSYLGFRTILTEKDGRKVQWSTINSGVAEPETMGGLDFASAEQRDDNITRAVSYGGHLYVFKETSIEVWQTTSSGVSYIPGRTFDVGLKSFNLVTDFPNGLFFVGSDNKVYILSGGQLQPVSTVGLETAIAEGSPSHCFHYQTEGHDMLVVRFTGRPAWCFDLAVTEWHERAYGTDLDPWPVIAMVNVYSSFIGSDLYGNVGKVSAQNYDMGAPLVRRAVSRTLHLDRARFRIKALELLGRTGIAQEDVTTETYLLDNDGTFAKNDSTLIARYQDPDYAPKVELRASRDWGRTWTDPKPRDFGRTGEYDKRVRWGPQGQFRQATFEITLTDSLDTPPDSQVHVEVA